VPVPLPSWLLPGWLTGGKLPTPVPIAIDAQSRDAGSTCKTQPLTVTWDALSESRLSLFWPVVSAEDGLDINVRRHSQVQVVQLRGPLRMGSAVDSLRQTIEDALGGGDTRILINLSEVPMIDSSGIGLLVKFLVSAKQRGGNIKLAQPSKFAVQTLRMVGVINLFEIYDSDDAAIESFA
jgi:anti-sigma B factor antagonist